MSQEFDNFLFGKNLFRFIFKHCNSFSKRCLAELVTKTKSGFFFVIPDINDGLKEIVTISRLAIALPPWIAKISLALIQAIGAPNGK